MDPANAFQALTVLNRAAQSEYGITVRAESDDPIATPALRAKQLLYQARHELGDPTHANLTIRLSPEDPDRELWIINRNASVEVPAGEPPSAGGEISLDSI